MAREARLLFCSRERTYFPCRQIPEGTEFGGLFRDRPLYALGRKRGGNFPCLAKSVKDCDACLLPHRREDHGVIVRRCRNIVKSVSDE